MLIFATMRWKAIGGSSSFLLLASLAVAALGGVSCSQGDLRTEPVGRPHIVFILIDTLRLDHTSIGGYQRNTTPGLQSITEEGLLFENHFANAPWTKSSVATILTGLSPGAHGAQWGANAAAAKRKVDVLSEGFETFPEVLQKHGYRTRAFMTNQTLSSSLGYAQGFDEYTPLRSGRLGDQDAIDLTKNALDRATEPTFIWCHLMAVHNYEVSEQQRKFHSDSRTPIDKKAFFARKIAKRFQYHEDVIDRYDDTVLMTDLLVKELTEFIRQNHPETLIIITSDHGEEFSDHGGYLHARTLYNELLRVPLVLLGPAIPQGHSVSRLTDHTDLFATLLDYLDLPASDTQGESLLRDPSDEGEIVYAEKRNGSFSERALISEEGKIIERKPWDRTPGKPRMAGKGRFEFFPDPAGSDDRNAARRLTPAAIADARSQFERIWTENQKILNDRTQGAEIQREMTEEEIEAMRALGYAE